MSPENLLEHNNSSVSKSLGIKIIAVVELLLIIFQVLGIFGRLNYFNFWSSVQLVVLIAAFLVLFSKNIKVYKISRNIVTLGLAVYIFTFLVILWNTTLW